MLAELGPGSSLRLRLLDQVSVVDAAGRAAVPLDRRFEGHQRIGDGLGHLGRGAVIGQLGVRVALALVDGRHDGGGDFGSREVIGGGRGDGVAGLLRGVRIAREAQGPVVVGELDAQGGPWRASFGFGSCRPAGPRSRCRPKRGR